jgi:hypothetical protein
MSPSNLEAVANKVLSGTELAKLILADFTKLLENDGLLSAHIGFGRITYEIILRKHMDNFMLPTDTSFLVSRGVNGTPLEDGPTLKDPSPEAIVDAQMLTREITSPNAERVRTGLPVPMDVRQPDGTHTQEQVTYPIDLELGDGAVKVTDVTSEARAAWGLPPEPAPTTQMATVEGTEDPT